MQTLDAIFYIVILIMSVVVHEVAHGFVAYKYGDNTALHAGRLTLNPLKHLDPFGSVILPALLLLSHIGVVFGWAKPVPYNPNNLRDIKRGTVAVASAGIIANLLLAIFFGLIIRFAPLLHIGSAGFYSVLATIVIVNIVLALFNLVPLPPLDGSKILFMLLPARYRNAELFLEKFSIIFLIAFLYFGWQYVAPLIFFLFHAITGVTI